MASSTDEADDDEEFATPPLEEGEGEERVGEEGDRDDQRSEEEVAPARPASRSDGGARTPQSLIFNSSPAHRALRVLPSVDGDTDSSVSGEPVMELVRRIRETSQHEEGIELLRKAKHSIHRDLQQKLDRIGVRANIIRFKYDGYKRLHDCVQICIILVSTLLSLLESVKAEFEISRQGSIEMQRLFTLAPIFMSSGIAVSLSLMKFKRYQEKMENMQKCIEKSIFITYRLKKIQDCTKRASSADELEKVYKEYTGEPYTIYTETQEEIERNLKFSDLVRHMKTYHELTLEFQRSEAEFEANCYAIANERAAVSNAQVDEVRLSPKTQRALSRMRGNAPPRGGLFRCCGGRRKAGGRAAVVVDGRGDGERGGTGSEL